jgi:hypothetical protein
LEGLIDDTAVVAAAAGDASHHLGGSGADDLVEHLETTKLAPRLLFAENVRETSAAYSEITSYDESNRFNEYRSPMARRMLVNILDMREEDGAMAQVDDATALKEQRARELTSCPIANCPKTVFTADNLNRVAIPNVTTAELGDALKTMSKQDPVTPANQICWAEYFGFLQGGEFTEKEIADSWASLKVKFDVSTGTGDCLPRSVVELAVNESGDFAPDNVLSQGTMKTVTLSTAPQGKETATGAQAGNVASVNLSAEDHRMIMTGCMPWEMTYKETAAKIRILMDRGAQSAVQGQITDMAEGNADLGAGGSETLADTAVIATGAGLVDMMSAATKSDVNEKSLIWIAKQLDRDRNGCVEFPVETDCQSFSNGADSQMQVDVTMLAEFLHVPIWDGLEILLTSSSVQKHTGATEYLIGQNPVLARINYQKSCENAKTRQWHQNKLERKLKAAVDKTALEMAKEEEWRRDEIHLEENHKRYVANLSTTTSPTAGAGAAAGTNSTNTNSPRELGMLMDHSRMLLGSPGFDSVAMQYNVTAIDDLSAEVGQLQRSTLRMLADGNVARDNSVVQESLSLLEEEMRGRQLGSKLNHTALLFGDDDEVLPNELYKTTEKCAEDGASSGTFADRALSLADARERRYLQMYSGHDDSIVNTMKDVFDFHRVLSANAAGVTLAAFNATVYEDWLKPDRLKAAVATTTAAPTAGTQTTATTTTTKLPALDESPIDPLVKLMESAEQLPSDLRDKLDSLIWRFNGHRSQLMKDVRRSDSKLAEKILQIPLADYPIGDPEVDYYLADPNASKTPDEMNLYALNVDTIMSVSSIGCGLLPADVQLTQKYTTTTTTAAPAAAAAPAAPAPSPRALAVATLNYSHYDDREKDTSPLKRELQAAVNQADVKMQCPGSASGVFWNTVWNNQLLQQAQDREAFETAQAAIITAGGTTTIAPTHVQVVGTSVAVNTINRKAHINFSLHPACCGVQVPYLAYCLNRLGHAEVPQGVKKALEEVEMGRVSPAHFLSKFTIVDGADDVFSSRARSEAVEKAFLGITRECLSQCYDPSTSTATCDPADCQMVRWYAGAAYPGSTEDISTSGAVRASRVLLWEKQYRNLAARIVSSEGDQKDTKTINLLRQLDSKMREEAREIAASGGGQ